MFRRILLFGLAGATTLANACATASPSEGLPRVAIATKLAFPKGVLARVSTLTLTVLEGNVTCDPTTGQTTLPAGPTGAKEIARRDLVPATGCEGGAPFCTSLQLDTSDVVRVFTAVAKGDGDAILALGCAASKIDQDAPTIPIAMLRYLEPANCGDDKIQPTEQCEPGSSSTCDDQCQTKELLLSVGSSQNGTQSGGVGDKTDPFLLWPSQSGTQGRFFAFYTDRAVSGSNNVEVSLRAMTDDLSPVRASESPALSAGSIYLPNGPTFPPAPAPLQQSAPQAAFAFGKYYVVFQDDTGTLSTGLDIHLRSMDGALVAEQGQAPLGVNGGPTGIGGESGAGEPAIQSVPAISTGPHDRLFIAWQDAAQGKIAGRTLTPPGTLGIQNDLSTGTGNEGVSLAAIPNGWIAVWRSGSGIKLRTLDEDGTPRGNEQTVNDVGSANERPRVAALPDGRFAVTWSFAGDVFVQRYDAQGDKITGDQASAINDVVSEGDQTTPSIAGTPAAGGSYTVAWLDAPSGAVRGRMLGGSAGFLFNNVNGQSTEFLASSSAGRVRTNPVVVAGGAGPFVAIGWEDRTAPGAGIVVRRFPLPAE